MMYSVQLTDTAKQDLRGIYEYIAYSLLEPDIAKGIVGRIIAALKTLRAMPLRHALYQEEPWRSRGLRRMNTENYSAFYLIIEQTVHVIRIAYCGRDIRTILQQSGDSIIPG